MEPNGSLLHHINQLIDSGKLNLPICNPAILHFNEVITGNSEHIGKVERMIMTDQALAAEVLRAANSPFYCGLSPVRTIRNAIVRVGLQQVQRLMILAMEQSKYQAYNVELNKMLKDLWLHASTTALAAQWLAQRLHLTAIEEVCFLGGLLHDIGKLVILRAIDEIKKSEGPSFAVSRSLLNEILTTTHCSMGYKLLQSWNLPEDYCNITRDHHMESIPAENVPLAIVRLANESSRKLGIGLDPNPNLSLAETPEACMLKASELLLAELEVMLEDHLFQAA